MQSTTKEKEIHYPAELSFKAVFRTRDDTKDSIESILKAENVLFTVSKKDSSKGSFNSYTVTATFPSNEILNKICSAVSALEGFQTLF